MEKIKIPLYLYIKTKLTEPTPNYLSLIFLFLVFFHILGLRTSIFMRGDLGGDWQPWLEGTTYISKHILVTLLVGILAPGKHSHSVLASRSLPCLYNILLSPTLEHKPYFRLDHVLRHDLLYLYTFTDFNFRVMLFVDSCSINYHTYIAY